MASSSGPNVSGTHTTNGLEVWMDVGFADAVSLSVETVRERLEQVKTTADEVKGIKKGLKEQLQGTTDEVKRLLQNTMDEVDKFKTDVSKDRKELQMMLQKTGEEVEEIKLDKAKLQNQLEGTMGELNMLNDMIERNRAKEANEGVEEPDEEEPGIAIEDQLRIAEQSAKAIDLLSSHLLSTVWQTCSKNTFGFYIRIMLLSGSQFKKQLIPETAPLIVLGFLTVLFSAAMQIILAYYLWTRLPPSYPEVNGDNVSLNAYPGTAEGRSYYDWYSPLLPAFQYPSYKYANDVCRTVPIVQLVTIGLFLFSILNNIPGVIKNFHIIWNSDRFISVDEDGITKLHYWRESQYSREPANPFLNHLVAMFDRKTNKCKEPREIKDQMLEIHNAFSQVPKGEKSMEIASLNTAGNLQQGQEENTKALKEQLVNSNEPESGLAIVSELYFAVQKIEAHINKMEEIKGEINESVLVLDQQLEALTACTVPQVATSSQEEVADHQYLKLGRLSPALQPFPATDTGALGIQDNNLKEMGRGPAISNWDKGTAAQILEGTECISANSRKDARTHDGRPGQVEGHGGELGVSFEIGTAVLRNVEYDMKEEQGSWGKQETVSGAVPEEPRFKLGQTRAAAVPSSSNRSAAQGHGIPKDDLKPFLCEMYLSGALIHKTKNTQEQDNSKKNVAECTIEYKCYAGAARRRWMLHTCFTEILPQSSWQQWLWSWIPSCFKQRETVDDDIVIPKSFFEVCETRSFLAEALRLMDQANNTKKAGIVKDFTFDEEPMLVHILRDSITDWPPPMDVALWPKEIQLCDQVRLNLVRIDYLRPSNWTRPHMFKWSNTYEKQEDQREIRKLAKALLSLNLQIETIKGVETTMKARKKKLMSDMKNTVDCMNTRMKEVKKRMDKKATFDETSDTINFKFREAQNLDTEITLGFEKLGDQMEDKEKAMVKALHSMISDRQLKGEKKKHQNKFSLGKCLRSKYLISCCCPHVSKPKKRSELLNGLRKYLGRDFADVLTSVAFSNCCPSMMIPFRVLAFTFGVLPELFSLAFMAVAGVQYILWSGFKVGSDTQGMEEIILATLAINFIYEIDDAVYDHVLPELYKEAHERDRFDITGYWISAETSAILAKCSGAASNWWWHKLRQWCVCSIKRTNTERKMDKNDCLKMLTKCAPIVCEATEATQCGTDDIQSDEESDVETKSMDKTATEKHSDTVLPISEQRPSSEKEKKVKAGCVCLGTTPKQTSGTFVFVTHHQAFGHATTQSNVGSGPVKCMDTVEKSNGLNQEAIEPSTLISCLSSKMIEELNFIVEEKQSQADNESEECIQELNFIVEEKQSQAGNQSEECKCFSKQGSKEISVKKTMEKGETILNEETKKIARFGRKFNKAIRKNGKLSDDWNDWDDELNYVHYDPVQGGAEQPNKRIHGSPFVRAMKMSVTDHWNDVYLAHAYPFLYARKLRYAFARHLWERFLVFYGMWGMHLVMLIVITIAIVGGYRTMARCDRFAAEGDKWLGVFAKQEWPNVCVLNVGNQSHQSFAGLENATAEELLAVSCGVSGYVPGKDEWARNRDYFAPPPPP